MNTNDLLAAAGSHQRVPFGMILLAIVVLGALGYGAVRLTHRVRLNRPQRPAAKPEPPIPAPGQPKPEPPTPRPAPPRPDGGWAVETHGLTKRFGPTVAVDDVELLVPRGSAFGYLGPNGAGKPVTELWLSSHDMRLGLGRTGLACPCRVAAAATPRRDR
jgi:hypothetical protein